MMIEVNLLPQEMRRVEHTPLPRLLIIVAGTTLVSVALAFGAIVNLRKLPDMVGAEMDLNQKIAAGATLEREHDLLMGQIEEVKQRKRAIAEIWRARIIWSKKLEQFSEMIPKFIGIEKLTLEPARRSGRDDEVGGYLNLVSVCAGADVNRLAMFRRILSGVYPVSGSANQWVGREWFEDFVGIDATPWVIKEMPDYEEKEALSFTLKLAIEPDDKRLKDFLAEHQKSQGTKTKKTPTTPAAQAGQSPPKETPETESSARTVAPADQTSGRASQ